MNEEQKQKWAVQLQSLWSKACRDAWEHFLSFTSMRFRPGDEAWAQAVRQKTDAIVQEEANKGSIRAAEELLYRTGDWECYFLALMPLYLRIRYEAYGPYWTSICKYDPETGTYKHPFSGAQWSPLHKIWKISRTEISTGLPPTQYFLEKEYKKQVEHMRWDEGAAYIRKKETEFQQKIENETVVKYSDP